MKKSRKIQLVLISAALAACNRPLNKVIMADNEQFLPISENNYQLVDTTFEENCLIDSSQMYSQQWQNAFNVEENNFPLYSLSPNYFYEYDFFTGYSFGHAFVARGGFGSFGYHVAHSAAS